MENQILIHVWSKMVLNKKKILYIQVCVYSMVMLVMMFNLGLFVGSHAEPGLGLSHWHARQQPQKPTQSLELSKKIEEFPRVPLLQQEDAGVVYDCLTWATISKYDPEITNKNYKTFLSFQGLGENKDHHRQSFIDIYNKQTWGGMDAKVSKEHRNYKASGPRSALERSQGVTAVLHKMIDRLKIQLNKTSIKILDLPCGNLQYMSHFLQSRADIDYTGADTDPAMIAKHMDRYKGKKTKHFKTIDIVKDELIESYDIILWRMMLQKLFFKDVLKSLYHFSKSNSTYLVVTTFSENKVNNKVRLRGARFRHLNLERPPINLSPPLCNYKEPHGTDFHDMAIWKLPLLQYI